MAELTASAGLPNPEIEDAGGCVTVRFRRSQNASLGRHDMDELTEQQQTILMLLDQAVQALPLREIHARLGPQTDLRRVREDLAVLKVRQLAAPVGHGRGARWNRL